MIIKFKHDENKRLSKNFTSNEFQSHDGTGGFVDEDLLIKLQILRTQVGKPITVTSGYRSIEHNKIVGGEQDSQHCEGTAADIVIDGLKPLKVALLAGRIGFTGIGLYKTITHVDVREVDDPNDIDCWEG